ncbi:MAG TPA: IPTL-CTERM sorting domain-containing protein, partial [Acidobacteria bacterium]|nr:IPTL-CTERM sorting domain-containing protein [Acidobacteriota bacterium]
YATDTFQSRFQSFNPDGTLREIVGVFGHDLGELDTPVGVTLLSSPARLAVASVNGPNVQIFRLDDAQPAIPEVVVSPASLDLGSVPVGERSDPAVVTLENTGTVPVGIYGIDSPDLFQVQTTCGDGLSPGESCTATVVFEPARAGRAVGTLRFRCSGQGDQTVILEARGTELGAAMAAISEGSVDFGTVPVGRTSTAHTLAVTNTGGVQLNVSSVLLGGAEASQFTIESDACAGASLGAGETCTIGVAFAPTGEGRHTAVLTVESNSAGGPLTVELEGEGGGAAAIPTVGEWGMALLVLLLGVFGWSSLRRGRPATALALVVLLATAGVALAVDPPHWYFGMDCASCHTGHNAAGGNLTVSAGNVNLCQSCHNAGGLASALPINSSDRAVPGQAGTSHRFDMPIDVAHQGAQMPTNPEMAKRIMNGNVVCSTCHDQHTARASNRGRLRVSTPERLTSFGSTGQVSVGGSYTGSGGSSYLIEITIADAHFRYSKDGGSTWAGEADIGTGVPLDNGLTVTFSGGTFALGERWRFTASYPFLRAALDQGDNTTGDRFCRDCHSLWTMDSNAVEVFDWNWKSHPVGVALNANGRGYDRTAPLDGNGAVQGSGGGDSNTSDDLRLDAGGLVQCLTCHGVHYTDSNTLTEDGP